MATENAAPRNVAEYVNGLPQDRAQDIEAVRRVILEHLPEGYQEEIGFGMITYVIPLERYPETYNGHPLMYAALASQKNYMSVYLMNVYGDLATEQWFKENYLATGKKLNMGKSCVRFKKLEDLPLELIGETVGRTTPGEYIQRYESARGQAKPRRRTRPTRSNAES